MSLYIQIYSGHKTQFQIEGGGVVQGVTKLISTFSAFFRPKTKIMPIKFTKNGVDSLFSGVKFFQKGMEKNQTR